MILAEPLLDDAANGFGLGDPDRHGRFTPVQAVARRPHRLEMHEIERERLSADRKVDLEAIAPEDAIGRLMAQCRQFRREQAELLEGHIGMAGHAHELDRLPVRRFGAHHQRHVDAPGIIARCGVFLAVALADHLEEIAVFERLERLDIVDLLQADDIRPGRGDGQRRQLPRVVRMGNGARLFEIAVFCLRPDIEQGERPVLVQLIAETGKVEPVHQVLDVERGQTKRHDGDHCPLGGVKTSPERQDHAGARATSPFIARSL